LKILRSKLFLLYIVFIFVYVVLTLTTKTDQAALAKYSLTAAQARALSLTIVIPYILIWLTALVGYLRLRNYALQIRDSKDGKAFRTISTGVLWLCLWLPISTITTALFRHYYALHPSTTANLVRIDNYINLIVLLFGFLYVYLGSKQLLSLVKKPAFTATHVIMLGYIVFSALYVLLTLRDPTRQFPTTAVPLATYYEPDAILVLTIVIPRLLMWFLGILGVYNIYVFSKFVKGSIYKAALNKLALGLGTIVLAVIVLRCVQSLSSILLDMSLTVLLVFVYALLLMISAGYILVSRGAKNLQKLENF
jgi:hypothetical protein